MDDAFAALRRYARNHNLTLRAVSQAITERTVDIRALAEPASHAVRRSR